MTRTSLSWGFVSRIGIQLKPSERLGIERFKELSGKVRCEALVPCLLLRKALTLQVLLPSASQSARLSGITSYHGKRNLLTRKFQRSGLRSWRKERKYRFNPPPNLTDSLKLEG